MATDRRTWFKLAAATLSSGAVIGATELGSRLLLGRGVVSSGLRALGQRGPGQTFADGGALSEEQLQSAHRMLLRGRWPLNARRERADIGFYENTPGVRLDVTHPQDPARRHFYSCIHEAGYRVPHEHDLAKPETGGVLFSGCSFTYGDEVEAEHTFAWQTAQRLGLPAFNVAGCSYSYATVVDQLEGLSRDGTLARLKPRAYVLGAWSALLGRSITPFYPTRSFQMRYPFIAPGPDGEPTIDTPPREDQFAAVLDLLRAYFPDGERKGELDDARRALITNIARKVVPNERERKKREPVAISHEQMYRFVVSSLARRCADLDIPFVVLWMATPGGERVTGKHTRALARACEESSVPLVEGALFGGSGHPDAQAHASWVDPLVETLKPLV
jgi:hypothetical protein